MALTFIGESVASAIIENLVNTGSSYLKECPAASRMQDELNRLWYALPQVQSVLTAVEGGGPVMVQNKAVDTWLWQLRDAVENAENVLDELEYYKLEKSIQDRDGKVRCTFTKCKRKFDSFINYFFGDDTLKRLREAVKKLDRVVASMGPLVQLTIGLYGPSVKRRKLEGIKNARESSSLLLTETTVLGRDMEKDRIVKWLTKPVDGESEGTITNIPAFTIVGMGGLGKTTLSQLICHDENVQEYFDSIMWVCVSQDFDAAAIMRKMLEGKTSRSLGDQSLNALHKIVEQKLTLKRFLLILDDVWNDDKMIEWEKLVAPLKFGKIGSKILLTTRMESVANMAARVTQCKGESINLNKLEESDCMLLFNTHAFLNVNPKDYKNLQPIGEKIVKKLGGCPLAIKVMGGLLNSYMNYDYWKRILKEETMKVQQGTMKEQQGENVIKAVLRLSYDHLATNLQLCFRYCSIFPQDYMFKRKELVYMWIGSGLISQSICGRQRPEDIGREYLDLLIRKSFFTCKTCDNGDKISKCYFMHDLVHELAQSVSLRECIRIRGDVAGNDIPLTVRHLSIEIINLLSIREISNLKNLRTLIISVKENHEHNTDRLLVFNEVIKGFKNLRLLSLNVNFDSYKLPDALYSLIHLRYLSLSVSHSGGVIMGKSFMDFLPQYLYRLYHLVVMKFQPPSMTSWNIEYDGLSNLVNLRSLDVPHDMIKNIRYVSKLPYICKLEKFFVLEECGYKISELQNLRDLRRLCIGGLENVSSEEAMEAKLKEKGYLKSLSLKWSRSRPICVQEDEHLLDNLCPHIYIKKLYIEAYQGAKSPCWMTDLSLVNLTSIELIHCKGWEHLPPLGQLPSLYRLYLSGLDAIKQIDSSFYGRGGGCPFPSLKALVFEGMPNLEEWIGINDGCMFHKLDSMKITGCPNLRGILTLPPGLNQSCISDVGLTTFIAINQDCRNNDQQERFKALETLTIEQCEKLEYVPIELVQKFNTVKVLSITMCPKLIKYGISDIQRPSIQ